MSTEPAADAAPLTGMIWIQTPSGVIGRDGGMPWHLPEDLAHFRRTTEGHPVIMGRRTWDSFPEKYRPLPGRTNIVITGRQQWQAPGAVVVHSLQDALTQAAGCPGAEEVWIIGGGKIFADAADIADTAVVTFIDSDVDGDTFAPLLGSDWAVSSTDPESGWHESRNGTRYRFEYRRRQGTNAGPGVA